jgi:outer membrane protein OmpA-like peptidoglycan-associated protein
MTRQNTWKLTCSVLVVALGVALSVGCATKKSLREGLATQDTKISDIEQQVESNQKRLDETNRNLENVKGSADEAKRLGSDAGNTANAAKSRADEAYGLAKGKLLYTVVLSETAGKFGLSKSDLSDEAKKALDDLASKLKSENANVYLEIQGHTDSSGPEEFNLELGRKRAEAVRGYLNATHGIPLHKMSVISFGESKPVAANDTRDGRSQNRRVEIRVLS